MKKDDYGGIEEPHLVCKIDLQRGVERVPEVEAGDLLLPQVGLLEVPENRYTKA